MANYFGLFASSSDALRRRGMRRSEVYVGSDPSIAPILFFIKVFEFKLRMGVSARDQPSFQNAAKACIKCSVEDDGRELIALNLKE
jgi:hypothetical protein